MLNILRHVKKTVLKWMTINLRPYQLQAINDICSAWQTNNRIIYQGATGSGKTEIAIAIIQAAKVRTAFVVHRKELVKQVSDVLQLHGISHGFIASGYRYDPGWDVYVCMVQTLARRPEQHFDLTIIDEAHHATSKSYERLTDMHETSMRNHAKILGLTATPRRLDGQPLNDRFDVLVQGPSIQSLIEQGYLSVPEVYVPPKTAQLVDKHRGEWKITAGDYTPKAINQFFDDNSKVIYGDVIEHYRTLAVDKPTIVFCPSVKSVYETVQLFRDNGIFAAGIDGSMAIEDRDDILVAFRFGKIKCLMSCDLISEGFDMPDAYAAIMLRPTKSLTVYLQSAGRVLRARDGKHKCVIIDHVNNTSYFGPPWIQRYWSLDGYTKRTKTDSLTGLNLKLCLKCGNYVANSCIVCPICGNPFKQKSKIFKTIYEDLPKNHNRIPAKTN